jgi:hypothetical protein
MHTGPGTEPETKADFFWVLAFSIFFGVLSSVEKAEAEQVGSTTDVEVEETTGNRRARMAECVAFRGGVASGSGCWTRTSDPEGNPEEAWAEAMGCWT